jgi:hypothetical protein
MPVPIETIAIAKTGRSEPFSSVIKTFLAAGAVRKACGFDAQGACIKDHFMAILAQL